MTRARKPYSPGDPIAWTHFSADGRRVRRTGVVIDRTPSLPSSRFQDEIEVAWWVQPDEALPGDLYVFLAVARSPAASTRVHGRFAQGVVQATAGRGELYASAHPESPTGRLVMLALQEMRAYAAGRVGGNRGRCSA